MYSRTIKGKTNLMLITLRENQSIPRYTSKLKLNQLRLAKIIGLVNKNLTQGPGSRQKNPLQIPNHVIPDHSLVGY